MTDRLNLSLAKTFKHGAQYMHFSSRAALRAWKSLLIPEEACPWKPVHLSALPEQQVWRCPQKCHMHFLWCESNILLAWWEASKTQCTENVPLKQCTSVQHVPKICYKKKKKNGLWNTLSVQLHFYNLEKYSASFKSNQDSAASVNTLSMATITSSSYLLIFRIS